MIIDIRDPIEYQKGHLSDAINIPFLQLYLFPSKYLEYNKTYTLYCNSGSKSSMLVTYLNHKGFHCVNLEGGYSKHLFQ